MSTLHKNVWERERIRELKMKESPKEGDIKLTITFGVGNKYDKPYALYCQGVKKGEGIGSYYISLYRI